MREAAMTFYYLIGHRDSTAEKYRLRNLLKVLQWIKIVQEKMLMHNDAHIIPVIIEQDSQKTLTNILENEAVEYVWENHAGPYNRSRGFNVGVRYIMGKFHLEARDVFLFSDNDVVMDPQIMADILITVHTESISVFSPYKSVHDMPRDISEKWEPRDQSFPVDAPIRKGTTLAGGILGMTYESFCLVGGWMEEFCGWGYEDVAMSHVISRFISKVRIFPENAFHLWHTHEKSDVSPALIEKNKQLITHLQMSNMDTALSRAITRRKMFGL